MFPFLSSATRYGCFSSAAVGKSQQTLGICADFSLAVSFKKSRARGFVEADFTVSYPCCRLALFLSIFREYFIMRYTMVLAALLFSATQVLADIGSIDTQRALTTVEQGKRVGQTLEKQFTARKAELDKEEQSIKKLQENFQEQGSKWSDAEKQRREDEFRTRVQAFQKKLADSQEEIYKKEQELAEPIVANMKVVIAEIARKKKLDVVLSQQLGAAYVKDSLRPVDITDEAIKAYNAKYK